MLRSRFARSFRLGTTLTLLLSLATGTAHAQLEGGADAGLNVDINRTSGGGAGVPASDYGAAAGQPGFWNNFLVGGPATINLSGLTGAPTGATLTRVNGAGIQSSCPGGAVPADF